MTLGGRACVDRAGYANVHAFFAMLEQLGPEAAGLEDQIAELCAQPDPAASERHGVQLMTIHKAKGLGFDVVIVPGLGRATRTESQPLLRWLEQTRLVGPEEEEEQEFVVAPIGRNGKQGGIYAWIGELQGRREDDEAKRLLYVAATRARKELHLLGTAVTKVNNELSPGERRSLLGSLGRLCRATSNERATRKSRHQYDAAASRICFPASVPLYPVAPPARGLEAANVLDGSTSPGEKSGDHRTAARFAGCARLRHRCARAVGGSGEGGRHRRRRSLAGDVRRCRLARTRVGHPALQRAASSGG